MLTRLALYCAVLMTFIPLTWAADTSAPKKAVRPPAKTAAKGGMKETSKAASKRGRKTTAKAAPKLTKTAPSKLKRAYAPASEPRRASRGKRETLTCREGTEDRHARLGVVLIGGKIDSFAYYSKWKPRTCSIYLKRNRDPYSKWVDKGSVTNVKLERGLFLLEHKKDEYRFVFREIDRERYCGMDGEINGTLTIRKGSERCTLAGIMEEGMALGEEFAHAEPAAAVTRADLVPTDATLPPRKGGWWTRRQIESPFPTPTGGVSD